MRKCITDYDLHNKKVIIRVDFNVPMKDGVITDDNRIIESLETIKYAISNDAKVILLSHLGRIKEESDLEKNSLEPVATRLSELLNKEITFINETRGKKLEEAILNMKNRDIILVQNTRYEDLDGKKESSNDSELGKYWASLGDIFINDAFGTCHRAHASNVGIASNLPSGIGFLVKKEIESISPVIDNPEHPFIVILGGSKVNDKIGVIKNLINKADYILVGGGMSYTFLHSKGFNIGKSLLDEENIDFCKEMINKYGSKIILPIDTITTTNIDSKENIQNKDINNMSVDDIGVDIGSKTIDLFNSYINKAKMVVWNGPMGIFEIEEFSNGTKRILDNLKTSQFVLIGGGDTASAAINMGYKDKFTHISTGGGACLEMLEGKDLPGVVCIDEKD